MLTRYLFPYRYKWAGWVLVVLAATLGLLEWWEWYKLPPLLTWLPQVFTEAGSSPTLPALGADASPRANTDLYALLFITGGLLAACSRERVEDEYISRIRLDSLLWALYAYYALLALAWLLISGMPFLSVMVYAMFAPLLLFLVRFQLALRFAYRALPDEK